MFKDYCNMKKIYNCPATEVITINAMTALCESQFGPFNHGGGTDTIDPENYGI